MSKGRPSLGYSVAKVLHAGISKNNKESAKKIEIITDKEENNDNNN